MRTGLILIVAVLCFANQYGMSQSKPPTGQSSPQTGVETELSTELLKVKRVYVDSFGNDSHSKELHASVINALAESKLLIVTENKDKADAILQGAGTEQTSQELHAIGQATSVGAAAGAHHGSVSGSEVNGVGSVSGSSTGGVLAKTMGISDSQASTETINDARLAVRLVAVDGDVIWTTTKESKGGKYEGATADVADQIAKQLKWDLDKLQHPK